MRKVSILAVTLLVILVILAGMGAVACNGVAEETTTPPPGNGQTTTPPPDDGDDTTPPPEETTTPPPEETTPPPEGMEITSTAFQNDETIPIQYTCNEQNISPPLSWSEVPEGTRSLALIMDDLDAPVIFTHWVIFNIPADALGLEEAIPATAELPNGALQGRNGFGMIGYGGPCHPPGIPHRYHFTLYALDITLDLSGRVSKAQVESAMQGHILDQAELIGLY